MSGFSINNFSTKGGGGSFQFIFFFFEIDRKKEVEKLNHVFFFLGVGTGGAGLVYIGSLTLEFDRLSFWTGNDSYRLRADTTNRKIMCK